MQQLKTINDLLDRAKAHTGSDNATAEAIGTTRQAISNWRHGHKPCPIEDQALLADLAGIDAITTIARGICERHAGTPKGARLLAVLGKSSAAIGAAIASGGELGGVRSAVAHLTRCIERLNRGMGRQTTERSKRQQLALELHQAG